MRSKLNNKISYHSHFLFRRRSKGAAGSPYTGKGFQFSIHQTAGPWRKSSNQKFFGDKLAPLVSLPNGRQAANSCLKKKSKLTSLLVHPQNRGGIRGASVQLACQRKTHFGWWMWCIFAGGAHLCADEPWQSQEACASQIDTVNPCSISRSPDGYTKSIFIFQHYSSILEKFHSFLQIARLTPPKKNTPSCFTR